MTRSEWAREFLAKELGLQKKDWLTIVAYVVNMKNHLDHHKVIAEESGWKQGDVDTASGAFTQDEINRAREWR